MASLAVFALAYTLSQFFRSFVAVIAPELSADLGLDPTGLGTLSAAWFIAFAAAQIPVGMALDRFGPRRTASLLMLSAVAGSLLFAAAHSEAEAVTGMALIGLGCAPVYMASLMVIGRLYPAERFATLSSAMLGFGAGGNVLGATPLAWAAGLLGWRGALTGVAGMVALSALLLILVVRDPPVPGHKPVGGLAGVLEGVGQVLATRRMWPLIPITLVSYGIVATMRGLWAGPYLAEIHHLDTVARGNALMALVGAMTLAAFAYGPLDRLLGTRRGIVAVGNWLTVAALALLAAMPDMPLAAVVALLMVVVGCGFNYAVLMAHGKAFVPPHLLGRGVTVMNLYFIGGVGLMQVGTGRLMGWARAEQLDPVTAYRLLFATLAAALVGALLIYRLAEDAPP